MAGMKSTVAVRVSLLLCGVVLMLAAHAAVVPGEAGGQADLTLEFTRTAESGGAARVSLLMDTTPERIWDVLLSCERSFEYVDGMRDCEVLEGEVRQQRVRQSVKKHWLLPRLEYVIEFNRTPYTDIGFRRIEGDLDLLEGRWRFEPAPGQSGTRVIHEIRVQPSFPVPRWLVRRSLASDLPDMLLCLRALAGGSGNSRQETEDRARCPEQAREGPSHVD
jgi:hypothetical protein